MLHDCVSSSIFGELNQSSKCYLPAPCCSVSCQSRVSTLWLKNGGKSGTDPAAERPTGLMGRIMVLYRRIEGLIDFTPLRCRASSLIGIHPGGGEEEEVRRRREDGRPRGADSNTNVTWPRLTGWQKAN